MKTRMKYRLLDPEEIHREGDELWNSCEREWQPVRSIHFGDPVGDEEPCRRPGSMDRNYVESLRRKPAKEGAYE